MRLGAQKSDCRQPERICLTPREREIVNLLLQGCDNAEIARQLEMAPRTVKAHLNRMFARFAISDGIKRVKLATLAIEGGGDCE